MYLHYSHTLDAEIACFLETMTSCGHGLSHIMLSIQCGQRKYENEQNA